MDDHVNLAGLCEDVRQRILEYCGFGDALALMRTTKSWYSSYNTTRIWKPIFYNTFNNFNPKPREDASDWLQEIKNKIQMYGPKFDEYRRLLGNVKICWKMDPPVQVGAGEHIHKTLGLYVDENLLPFMGYFGPNDVCYSDWIKEVFKPLFHKFDTERDCAHSWDFCDQAMPEFVFVKEGPICKLSICDGICGGKADLAWQNIEFLIEDFRVEYIKFLEELYRELHVNYGKGGQEFWDQLGIDMSKDGKYIKDKEPNDYPQTIDYPQNIEGMLFPRTIKFKPAPPKLTIDDVPKERHVFFDSSDSSESEDNRADRSSRNKNKSDKKDSQSKKRKAELTASDEELPKKKHKKEKEKKKSKDKHKESKNKNKDDDNEGDKKEQ